MRPGTSHERNNRALETDAINAPRPVLILRSNGAGIPSPYKRVCNGPPIGAEAGPIRPWWQARSLAPELGALRRQPRDRAVVHGHCLGDRPATFAGGQALEGFGPLMIGELRLWAEPHALVDGNLPAGVASGEDRCRSSSAMA